MTSELLVSLISCALRVTCLLGIAWTLTVVMRRASASTRHFLWVCAIAAAALLPVIMMVLPQWRLSSPRAFSEVASIIGSSALEDTAPKLQVGTATATERAIPLAIFLNRPAPSSPILVQQPHTVRYSAIAATVWAAGTIGVLLYLFIGFIIARRLRKSATSFNSGWVEEAQTLARCFRVGSAVSVVESAKVVTPLVYGFWRATIILPRGSSLWPQERLRIVLLHELAHVKRKDYLTQALAQLVCAVYWFSPLVWVAARCLYAERERACDDFVLATGTKASDYARHLVDIARAMRPSWLPMSVGPAMARRSKLEERLVAILDSKTQRSSALRARLAAVAVLLSITGPLTALQLRPPSVVRTQLIATPNTDRPIIPGVLPIGTPLVEVSNESDLIPHGSRVNGAPQQSLPQAKNFEWNGSLNQGGTLEVRGVYGSIRAIASTNGLIQINAHIHNSALVRLDVVPRENGITICSVTSTSNGDESECQPGPRAPDVQKVDVAVDFVIEVPSGVRFAASMIHGNIALNGLESDIRAATINGDISVDLSPGHGADFYGNTVSGIINADFPIYESAPPLPSSPSADAHRPQIVRAIIGNGGPALVASTVSGNIRLRKKVE